MSTRLQGHVPAWAAGSRDRGRVEAERELEITFVLSRSPELQAQFAQLLTDQQDPGSLRYHRWLTPQQVGEQYGPTQGDLDALRDWVSSQGLAVREVAPSGIFVRVSGPALTVGRALGTEFHYFERSGGLRIATTEEPAVPSVFAPIISLIAGLATAEVRPMHHIVAQPVAIKANADGVHPEYTSGSTHFLSPGDFAAIFDLNPVYNSGFNGAGQKVAVIGESRVANSDMTAFESKMGLPSTLPNVVIPPSGVDPGLTSDGAQGEAALDVQRVIGVAPGAQVDLVVSSSTANYSGIYIAAQYEVQTLRDPVMNLSFGGCEVYSGASGVALWDALFSQAASEGISVFVSSGDSGAAACDDSFELVPAYQFLSINDICSSSYVTCVGGTELADFSNPSQYWSSANSTTRVSALSYIPEGAWNESTYNFTLNGYVAVAGGGGASVYVAKPAWQTGTGVPADHARDVPDISFPSANHDGYYGCVAAEGGDCSAGNFLVFSGTSTASPAMAGVAAILNQKMGGPQGNLNPLLYRLAVSSPNAFHDATPASSGVSNCSVSTPSLCNISLQGLAGYAVTTGYDLATGLGSLDIANFLTAAASASHPSVAATTLSVHGSATTISYTQTAAFTATISSTTPGVPVGTVQFYANGNALGAPVNLSSGTASTAALPFTSAGTYYITAMYSGDSNYAASTAPGITLTVTGRPATTTVKASSSSIPVGTKATFTVTVAGSSGLPTPTGTVRFLVLGTDYGDYVTQIPLVNGSATTPALSFPTTGSYTVTAQYLGDTLYSPSSSAPVSYTVTKMPSATNISFSWTPQSIGIGGGTYFVLGVGAPVSIITTAPTPTGMLQYYLNGVAQGSPFTFSSTPAPVTFPGPGTYAVTAAYSGDSSWLPSTSNAISQTVISQPATFTMTTALNNLAITAGGTNSELILVNPVLGFFGTANLICTVAYSGNGPANAPTCGLTSPGVTINGPQSGSSLLTISSVGRTVASSHLPSWGRSGTITLCALALWLVPIRRRSWRALTTAVVLFAGLMAVSGCGDKGSSASSGPTPTTPGSYTITISATTPTAGITPPTPMIIVLTIN